MKAITSPKMKLASILFAGLISAVLAAPAQAAGAAPEIERQSWSFTGPFGTFDRGQLQRGYQVYKEVCSGCHGMKFLHFRNLGEPGGPEFPEAAVKALAAEAEVQDGPNDEGEMFDRPGRPSDAFPSPFPNDQAARAANNGALPPDLSVIAKARGVHKEVSWYVQPFHWLSDILTTYEEKGADYLYALLTGYAEPPEGVTVAEGMNYNKVFPGHQIAMAEPLSDEAVEYTDGTPATLDNHARDVTAFLMWAAEPKLEERHKIGFRMMIYLVLLAGILYVAKRRVWKDMDH